MITMGLKFKNCTNEISEELFTLTFVNRVGILDTPLKKIPTLKAKRN